MTSKKKDKDWLWAVGGFATIFILAGILFYFGFIVGY